jgi:hypothetical protein
LMSGRVGIIRSRGWSGWLWRGSDKGSHLRWTLSESATKPRSLNGREHLDALTVPHSSHVGLLVFTVTQPSEALHGGFYSQKGIPCASLSFFDSLSA